MSKKEKLFKANPLPPGIVISENAFLAYCDSFLSRKEKEKLLE